VLIVEDNELVTGALRILFEETGRRVTVAHSVSEAITASEQDPPDLVLLDLTLFDTSSYELAQSLREHAPSRRLRLIALTFDPGHAAREEARAAFLADALTGQKEARRTGVYHELDDVLRELEGMLDDARRRKTATAK